MGFIRRAVNRMESRAGETLDKVDEAVEDFRDGIWIEFTLFGHVLPLRIRLLADEEAKQLENAPQTSALKAMFVGFGKAAQQLFGLSP